MTGPPPPAPTYATQVCYRHPSRNAGVRCVRCDRPICSDCMVTAAVGFQCPECVREGSKTVRARASTFGGRARETAPVTYGLIGINVAVFLLTVLTAPAGRIGAAFAGSAQSNLFDDLALIPPAVVHGEFYRLLTSAFLHFGILHIGFNMVALYFVGPALETALGRWRYLALYLLAGLGGSILTVALSSPDTTSAGASGAIFGVFGAVYVLQRQVNAPTMQSILPVIVINLVLSFTIPNISWQGHIGGLITGSLIALALVRTAQQVQGRLQRHVGVFVVAAILLAGLGFAAADRASSTCASTTDHNNREFCAYYDPPSAAGYGRRTTDSVAGNLSRTLGVIPSESTQTVATRALGGPHA